LSRRESWWKDAEILMLRHQLSVALREQPRAHSRLTWPDRAWLALLAGTLPVERLAAMRLIVTPGTILRWHRDIVRRRWARRSRHGPSGRPPVRRKVRSVVLRLARENESWGYRRIHGELAGLGITMAPSTVWQILKSAGITRHRAEMGLAGRSSCDRRHRGSWRLTCSPPISSTARRVCPGRDRAWHPPCPGPWRYRAPGPVVGCAAGPESADEPGRSRDAGKVRAARPGRQLHCRVRRGVHRDRRADHQDARPGASGETVGFTLHLFGSVRGALLLSWWKR
jgi:transposase